jgi:hypothetical protein
MGLVTCPDCANRVSDAAAACIHCGRPIATLPAPARPLYAPPSSTLQRADDYHRSARAEAELACPSCGSPSVKRLSLVHREGISSSTSATGGLGFAGGHVGVVHAATKGSSQTLLSRQFAPPTPKSVLWPAIGMIIFGISVFGGVVTFFGSLGTVERDQDARLGAGMMLLIYGPLLLLSIRAYRNRTRHNEQQPKLMRQWENSFLCGRCGDVFVATPTA